MAEKRQIDRVLLDTAKLWSSLGTCRRLKVGAVAATEDGVILSSGFNGAASGLPHCEHPCDCGHEFSPDPNMYHLGDCEFRKPCTVAVHAEANVIARAAREQVSLKGSTLVTTHATCRACASLIIQAGISRVIYETPYRDAGALDLLRTGGVLVERYEGEEDAQLLGM